MTKPKLVAIALLALAAAPIACAIRNKNPPGPAPQDQSPVKPFGASTWNELPALYSGDVAATAGPSARVSATSTASASAAASAAAPPPPPMPPVTAPPPPLPEQDAEAAPMPPFPLPMPPLPLPRPHPTRSTGGKAAPPATPPPTPTPAPPKATATPTAPPAPSGEPTCEQLVAKMGRILHGSGAQPLPADEAQRMLEQCKQSKQKAPVEWKACTSCMLKIDESKPDLKACRTPCDAMEKKARGGS